MPRPTKCRRVCRYPEALAFLPQDTEDRETVVLTVDEFEAVRLIDRERLSQEEASRQMGVARATVQRIYDNARRKLADMLVCGLSLRIEGGDYRLCGSGGICPRQNCEISRLQKQYEQSKGECTMRIAVTYENGEVFQHFGHTAQFKLYDAQDGKVVSSQVVSTDGSGHGALAGILRAVKADVLICGGIGGGAKMALAEAGIQLYGGVSGSADQAVDALLAGSLSFDPEVHCSHHDHEHGAGHHSHEHGAHHTCGDHGCGHGHGHCDGHGTC